MARLFGGAATDAASFGAAAAVNNLTQSGQTLGLVVHRRSADSTGVLLSKMSALTAGFALLTDQAGGGTEWGNLRLITGRATTRNDVTSTTGNAAPLGQHTASAFSWDSSFADGSGGTRLYQSPLEQTIQEVSGYSVLVAGSGSLAGDDSAASLRVGNWALSDESYEGDLGWAVLVHKAGATPWTAAQVVQAQAGVLTCLAGDVTRGLAILAQLGTVALLAEVQTDGTLIDHSPSALTGTLTGTTPGTDQPNWHAPTAFFDDTVPSDSVHTSEQVRYRYTSAMARTRWQTAATAVDVWAYRTLDAQYDAQSRVALLVDGAWSSALDTLGVDTYSRVQFTGLSAADKVLDFLGGATSRPISLTGATPSQGTFPVLLRFDASATELAPTAGNRALSVLTESVWMGFLADPVQQLGVMSRVRLAGDAGIDRVRLTGWGGWKLRLEAPDAAGRANVVAQLTQDGPAGILLAVGANDALQGIWTLAQFTTAFDAFLTDLLAAYPAGPVLLMAPIINANEGANAQGWSLSDLRSYYASAAAAHPGRVFVYDPVTPTLVVPLTDLPDGTHPDNTGHGKLYTFTAAALAERLLPAAPASSGAARRIGRVALAAGLLG